MPFYCGVEGGATNTTLVVLDEAGKIVKTATGGCSNHYLTSMGAVAELLHGLAAEALPEGAPASGPLFASFGACMSGFLAEGPQRDLVALFREKYPRLAASYYIDNDSPGSIFTAAKGAGGCVIIAGTGSMGQLMLPSGEVVNCGGHGHAYGDGAQDAETQ
jgi:N-acetylglucosamine kinase